MSGVIYRLIEPGANLHVVEAVVWYALVFWFAFVQGEWGSMILELAWSNFVLQTVLFVVVVQIPLFFTGRMAYVDIAWPSGLVGIAVLALRNTDGYGPRRNLIGTALLLHGARMMLGALVMFFPYIFKEDLPRYQYAKQRWIFHTHGNKRLWWLKQQHDTAMQAMFNCVGVGAPIFLTVTNPTASLHWMEIGGFALWFTCWVLESLADIQKLKFVAAAKQNGDIKTAVLGFTPYDGPAYWLWKHSRHPNYFFEWLCWVAMMIMALPSAMLFCEPDQQQSLAAKIWLLVLLVYVPRMFYDCLVHWTGAGPAEAGSVTRRPLYRHYQKTTNVLFPFNLPLVDHHRTAGWPQHTE
eukprot:m.33876 g.33876  ORF g.33876 m.33876 type:complete len:352 (-) comp16886_c0_seq2:44-1099(-)